MEDVGCPDAKDGQSVTSTSQSVTSITSKSKLGLMKRLSISVSQTAANALPSTCKQLTLSSSSLPTLHGGDASMSSSANISTEIEYTSSASST
eukprot:6031433-Ditylum_brightwellii.AAC.1